MPIRLATAWRLAITASLLAAPLAQAQQTPPTTTPPPATEPSAKTVVAEVEKAEKKEPITDPIERIKDEAMNRSQVMATLSYLTDVIGPRLTASPGMKRANEWTRDQMTKWGLENAHLEAWGPFGKGWTLQNFSMQVVEPQCIPLIAFPKAWSPGLDGVVTGEVIDLGAIKTEADLDKMKGKLKGAYVILNSTPLPVDAHFVAEGSRLTDPELLELANAAEPAARRPRNRPQTPATPTTTAAGTPAPPTPPAAPAGRGGNGMTPEQRATAQLNYKKLMFAAEEGAAAILDGSRLGDGGTLFVAQASVPAPPAQGGGGAGGGGGGGARRASAWDKDAKILPQITIAKEHFNRLVRMMQQGEKIKIKAELAVKFHDDAETFNTVAEIPGTDLKDEVVMLGGHMDSWHSGTGATDNAAGVSVGMEAVRILKTLDIKPRRTIRIALWSGEEEGLYGSRGYVKEHFGYTGDGSPNAGMAAMMGGDRTPPKITTKPEYDKFSGYFNLDNGTGKIRGIYLQGNEAVRTVFRPWLAPFRDMGAATITISNTGGTDHQSFDAIGLPGFQFIQDVIEYDARTHHSNQDVYDRIQAEDMKQAAAIMAAFVLNTANRDEKLPRKPTPNLVPATPTSTPTPTPAPVGAASTNE